MKKNLFLSILSMLVLVGILFGCDKNGSDPVVTTTGNAETTATTEKESEEDMLSPIEGKYAEYIYRRNDLHNTLYKLKEEKKLKVLYYGGSVTYGVGASAREKTSWRALFTNYLKESYPDAEIESINSAISGTGSLLGLFRLERDVIPHNPDLIFIEYSINDFYLGAGEDQIKIQNETMIRRLYEMNPNIDIVYVFTEGVTSATTGIRDKLHKGSKPQNEIAEYFGINSVNVGRALTDTISDKSSASSEEWKQYFQDGVHPVDKGYAAYFEVLKDFFENQEKIYKDGEIKAHKIPENPLVGVMEEYTMIAGNELESIASGDWKFNPDSSYIPNINSVYQGSLSPKATGSELTYTFTGKGFSIFFSGNAYKYLECSIDGSDWKIPVSDGNRPLTIFFDNGVEAKEHTVKLRIKNGAEKLDFEIFGLLIWEE